MNVEIHTDPASWDAYLDRVPGATNYHYWRWRSAIQDAFGHTPYYLAALDEGGIRGVLPLVLVRSRLFGTSLVSMPYFSYGGVVADTPEAQESLLARAAALAVQLSARHVELRQGDACQTGWQERKSKVTMRVPLPAQPEELMSRLSPGVRKKIRQAPRYGLTSQWGGVESLDIFYRIFALNMRNLGTPVYPQQWFANLLRCAPEAIRILTIWDGGDAVAGAFLIAFRDTLEVPWAASVPDSRRKNCNLFLYWTFLEWAIQQGYRDMDLGRCTPGGGNFEFKRHLRGEERPLHWYYWLAPGTSLPELRPDAGRYQFAAVFGGASRSPSPTSSDLESSEESHDSSAPMKNGRHIDLFVLIDALGWEYVKDREFLSDLLPYRRPLRTVLGYSSGAIPAILSGLPPSQNGHWNLYYYDPTGSPFRWLRHFGFLPSPLLDNRVTSKLLKEIGRRFLGLGPLFECFVKPSLLRSFNWVEKRNIYAPGGIGGAASIFDELKRLHVPYRAYSYHGGVTDKEILDLARRDLESGPIAFSFLYLSQMDHFLHTHCAEPAKVGDRIRWYEEELRRLFEAARNISPDASLTVFSDHGMTPVLQHYNLVRTVEALDLRTPEDYLAVYDSTMARFWFFSSTAKAAVSALLKSTPCGRILTDTELKALGVFFDDRRYGELVFLLDPGWLLADSNFGSAAWLPAGMHGYHPDDRYSDACSLSDREPPVEVRTITDVYDCMHNAIFRKYARE